MSSRVFESQMDYTSRDTNPAPNAVGNDTIGTEVGESHNSQKGPQVVYNAISTNEIELLYNKLPISAGLTIANSLRRQIISFSPGYAITFVRIVGAPHNFASIPGVKEDYINVIANIRGLIIKHDPKPAINEWIKIQITGPAKILGENFNVPGKLEILNKDHEICSLSPHNTLELEFMVTHGNGYTSEENLKTELKSILNMGTNEQLNGIVVLEANYNPVQNVRYNISEPFNGTEDMAFVVKTNGAVNAESIIKVAISSLVKLYQGIDPNLDLDVPKAQENDSKSSEKYEDILSILIDSPTLKLSTRSINGLHRQGIYTIGDLARHRESELISFQSIGATSVKEIRAMMKSKGVEFAQARDY